MNINRINTSIVTVCFATALWASSAQAGSGGIAATSQGTGYNTSSCPCTGPVTGIVCTAGETLFTYDSTYQSIDGVCGQQAVPDPSIPSSCAGIFTGHSESCVHDVTTVVDIVSVVGRGIAVTYCKKGGTPTQAVSSTLLFHSGWQGSSSGDGLADLALTQRTPVDCDGGFGRLNLSDLGNTLAHFSSYNPTLVSSGGIRVTFIRK